MGDASSKSSSESDGEDSQCQYSRTSHTYSTNRIDREKLLTGLANKCKQWLEIIENVRQNQKSDYNVDAYLYQELKDTKEELDVIVVRPKSRGTAFPTRQ